MDNPEHDAAHEAPTRDTEAMLGFACFIVAVVLLVLLPFATRGQPAEKAWFLSPRNAPLLGILMVGLPGLVLSLRLLRGWRAAIDPRAYLAHARWAFGDLAPAIGYTLLFCAYMAIVPWIGFAISTLIFGQACLWLSGLRGARWAFWNLAFVVVIVLVLRVGLGLWFPYAPVFSLLPASIGNFLSSYL